MRRKFVHACGCMVAAWAFHNAAAQYSFQGLGVLPGKTGSQGWDVSGDGLVVVGDSGTDAFRWTQTTGLVDLGHLGSDSGSSSRAALRNGEVVVGTTDSGFIAFRWTQATGMVDIGKLPNGPDAFASDVSADGAAVVGYSGNHAFRWTKAGGMLDLGTLNGAPFSQANAVSADGLTAVGRSGPNSNEYAAFRWTQADGMVSLGTLPGEVKAEAWGVNADGSVVVGRSGGRAFRWTKETRMVDIGKGWARDATPDGLLVAGDGPNGGAAFWTAKDGWVTLDILLISHGVDLTDWSLNDCHGVSDDGGTLVGVGLYKNTQALAWLATIPPRCQADCDGTGDLDVDDFICFQGYFAQGSLLADCDRSGELDVDDFICYQTMYGLGCR